MIARELEILEALRLGCIDADQPADADRGLFFSDLILRIVCEAAAFDTLVAVEIVVSLIHNGYLC